MFFIFLMKAFMFVATVLTVMIVVNVLVARIETFGEKRRRLSLLLFFSLLASILWSSASIISALIGYQYSQTLLIYAGPLFIYASILRQRLKVEIILSGKYRLM